MPGVKPGVTGLRNGLGLTLPRPDVIHRPSPFPVTSGVRAGEAMTGDPNAAVAIAFP